MTEEFTISVFQFCLKDKPGEHYSLMVFLPGGHAVLDDLVNKSYSLMEIKYHCKEWAAKQLARWQENVAVYQPE